MAEQQGSGAFGGYEDEFVDAIEDDWLCPICHLPLKVPVQTRGCGHRFCELCLERHFMRQERDGQQLTCPLDQNVLIRDKDIFPDKAAERKVRSFVIKCPRGCQWTGELRSKEDHENECRRFPVNCPNCCAELVPREEVSSPTENNCSLAPIACPYAEMGCSKKVPQREIESHLNSETRMHLDLVCTKLKNAEEELRKTKDHLDLTCTKLTNTETELQNTKDHLDLACTKLTNTEEELWNTEDDLDLTWTKLTNTEEELWKTEDDLDLTWTKLTNTEEELWNTKEDLENTEEELQNIKERFEETTKKHEERIHALENKPFIYMWKINGFSEINGRISLTQAGPFSKDSDPFYTGECSYKVRLRLELSYSKFGRNNCMAIYLIIMKGDFDSFLKWPFAKRATVTLLDQQQNSNERKNITATLPENQLQQEWNSRPCREYENRVFQFALRVSRELLRGGGYVQDNSFFIQAKFETVAP